MGPVVDATTGQEKVVLENEEGSSAEIYLHGAHVTSFKPKGQEVIFVSKQAIFDPPTAIRGGVPVCWPQFNDMGTSGSHGFARNSKFEVAELDSRHVVMLLRSSVATLAKWNHSFELRVSVELTLDSQLNQTVEVLNSSAEVMRFTNALHTYFKVTDVRRTTVTGLEGCTYHDNLDGRALKAGSSNAVTIGAEVDRIYTGTGPEIRIHDAGAQRTIVLGKENFADAVVWNPWVEKAKSFKDFADEEYESMLCVEPANASIYLAGGAIEVQPGSKWRCQQNLKLVKD